MGFLPLSDMQNFKIKIKKPKIKINKPKINLPKLNIVKPNLPKVNLPKVVLPKIDRQIEAIKKLQNLPEKYYNAMGTILLAPYKALMVSMLKKRGQPVTMKTNLDKVAILFYKVVVLGRQNFKNYDSWQHLQDEALLVDDKTGKPVLSPSEVNALTQVGGTAGGMAITAGTQGAVPPQVGEAATKLTIALTKKILQWIKEKLNKKKKGEQLTEEDKEIDNAPIPEAPTETKKKKKGNWFTRLIHAIFGGANNEDFENFRRRIDARNRPLSTPLPPPTPTVGGPRTVSSTILPTPSSLSQPVLSNYTCNATELQADLMSKGLNFNGIYTNPVQSANDYLNITQNLGRKKYIVKTINKL